MAFHATGESMCLLQGSAGTGKTTLVCQLVAQLKNARICISAPTNKALHVLRSKCRINSITYSTIHRLFAARQSFTQDGKSTFVFNIADAVRYDWVIVDEASMIDSVMMQAIESYSKKYNTFILFVGDNYQLPPVGAPLETTVFQLQHIATLTTIMRAKNGTLLKAFDVFRKYVTEETLVLSKTWMLGATNNQQVIICSATQFNDIIMQFNVDTDIILAYSNIKVAEYCSKIRNLLWPNVIDKYVAGEHLLYNDYRMIKMGNTKISFYTSSQVVATEVCIDQIYHPEFETTFKTYVLTLYSPEHKAHFTDYIVHEECLTNYNRCVASFKVNIISTKQPTTDDWTLFYRAKDRFLAPLSYAYATTIHKAQGSTYQNIFVDGLNVRQCTRKDPHLMRRCIYTAITRAANHATICLQE